MAYEAPMEAWFTPSECIPDVSQLGIHGLERVGERRAGLREAEAQRTGTFAADQVSENGGVRG
jgi:hypothetical protein